MGLIPPIALSVRQPWAWAIIFAGKDVENRSEGAVRHGMRPGRIAIHASKGMTQDEYAEAAAFMADIGVKCPSPDLLVRGAIIGDCEVTHIVSNYDSPWFFGPRGLLLGERKSCVPVPAIGALGYFKWKPSGGTIDPAKPWMTGAKRARRLPTFPLLTEQSGGE